MGESPLRTSPLYSDANHPRKSDALSQGPDRCLNQTLCAILKKNAVKEIAIDVLFEFHPRPWMTDPELLFQKEHDICYTFRPYEALLFMMFSDVAHTDKALKRIEGVVKGRIADGMQDHHHLVDFRYHVDGLPVGLVMAKSTGDYEDDLLAVRPSHYFNCMQPRWSGTPQYNPSTFAYHYHPRSTKDLQEDFESTARYQRDWRYDCERYEAAKARKKWIYGDIGPLSGDEDFGDDWDSEGTDETDEDEEYYSDD
jgi:hypothetical protein